jgi:putative Mg2+ transporter-C (MgtC) family protein
VHGLTTAAGIWATAAIGVAVGLGREATAIVSAVTVVVILGLVLRLEKRMRKQRLIDWSRSRPARPRQSERQVAVGDVGLVEPAAFIGTGGLACRTPR